MIKKNIAYGLIGLAATVLGFLEKSLYRDYIHSNAINDWGIEGFLPSYFYVVGFSLLLLVKPAKYPVAVVSIVTLASVLFEFKQYFSTDFFDLNDVLASTGGGMTALIIVKVIERKNKDR